MLQLNRKDYLGTALTRQGYHFDYDAWGNTTKIYVGAASDDTSDSLYSAIWLAEYEYNVNGTISKMTYTNSDYVLYSYDLLDRLISEVYYNHNHVAVAEYHYVYNANGQLAKQYAKQNGVVTEEYCFEYDSLGRLIRSREEGGSGIVQRTEHLYDTANRLSKQSWVVGARNFSEEYSYDSVDGNLSSMKLCFDEGTGTDPATNQLTYTYDGLNRLTQVLNTQNYVTPMYTRNYGYKDYAGSGSRTTSLLDSYVYRKPSDNSIIAGNAYDYDANGNITTVYEVFGSDQRRPIAEYTYDSLNQLKTETRKTYTGSSTTPTTTTVVTYTIDTAGNISSVETKVNGVVTNTVEYAYGNNYWSDRLTAITANGDTKSIHYSYYGGGNTNPNDWYNGTDYTNLTWTQGRRLSSITKGSSTYSYEYDMSGVRSVKIVDGWKHEYVTQNGRVVRDKVTDASTGAFQYVLEFGYDESGRPLTLRWYYNEAETWYNAYYYICNAQGDVVKLVSDSGATIAAYSYDAWGTLLSIQGESNGDAFIAYANPLRYRDYYYDTETGFYYLQSRYYDPAICRFVNADSYSSTGQGILGCNMFSYCNNCPITRDDPKGEFFGAICGAVGGFVGGLVGAVINGDDDPLQSALIGAGTGFIAGACVDFAVATGGVGGIVIAAGGGVIAGGLDSVANDLCDGKPVDWGSAAFSAVLGGVTNLLSLGLVNTKGLQSGAKSLKEAAKDFLSNGVKQATENTTRRVAGSVVPKSVKGVLKNLAKNIINGRNESALISCFCTFFKKGVENAYR